MYLYSPNELKIGFIHDNETRFNFLQYLVVGVIGVWSHDDSLRRR